MQFNGFAWFWKWCGGAAGGAAGRIIDTPSNCMDLHSFGNGVGAAGTRIFGKSVEFNRVAWFW